MTTTIPPTACIEIEKSKDLEKSLTEIVNIITDTIDDVAAIVWLLDEEGNLVVKAQAYAGDDLNSEFKFKPNAKDFIVTSFQEATLQSRDNLYKTKDFLGLKYAKNRRWQSALAYPLLTAEARYGVLGVYTIGHRGFTRTEQKQIKAMATLLPFSMEAIRQKPDRIKELIGLQNKLTDRSSLKQTLADVAENIYSLFNADYVSLYIWDGEAGNFDEKLTVIHPAKNNQPPLPKEGGASYQALQADAPVHFIQSEVADIFTPFDKKLKIQNFWELKLSIAGDVAGTLRLSYVNKTFFDADFVSLLTNSADTVAAVISEARLRKTISSSTKQLEEARTVMEAIYQADKNPLQTAVAGLTEIFHVQQATLFLFDRQTGFAELYAEHIAPNGTNCVPAAKVKSKLPLNDNPLIAWLEQYKTPFRAIEAQTDPILETVHKLLKTRNVTSTMILPLFSQLRELIGVVEMNMTTGPRNFSEREAAIAQLVANQIVISYETVSDKKKRERERVLVRMGKALTLGLRSTEEEIVEMVQQEIEKLLKCKNMYVAIYDVDTNEIRFDLHIKDDKQQKTASYFLNKDSRDKVDEIIISKKPILHKIKHEAKSWYDQPGRQKREGNISSSWVGVPIIMEDKVIGVIVVYDLKQEYAYNDSDLELLLAIANQTAIALDSSRLYYDFGA